MYDCRSMYEDINRNRHLPMNDRTKEIYELQQEISLVRGIPQNLLESVTNCKDNVMIISRTRLDLDYKGDNELEEEELFTLLYGLTNIFVTFLNMMCAFFVLCETEIPTNVVQIRKHYSLVSRVPEQIKYLRKVIGISDEDCINHLRMSRGRTVSKHFYRVLNSVIRLHSILLSQPKPIDENYTNGRWRHFKGCLWALDGTYINVTVPVEDRARYRNRNGDISVNVLAVCDINMNYVYVLTGWEGSAADSRVLRNAITRSNGFRIPQARRLRTSLSSAASDTTFRRKLSFFSFRSFNNVPTSLTAADADLSVSGITVAPPQTTPLKCPE
ncbi:hypothetical protein ACS0TY_027252 [Phlomoides rotata]